MKHIITILLVTAATAMAQQVNFNNNRSRARADARANALAVAQGGNATARQRQQQQQTQLQTVTNTVNANPNVTVDASSVSTAPSAIVTTDYVEWKRYQDERRNSKISRTKPGATISPLDPRAVVPVAPTQPITDSKARYDAFLREKGINPNTIGHATLVAGRLVVPTVERQYASRDTVTAQTLAINQ